jgi:polyhydroxyalkanoate synthase
MKDLTETPESDDGRRLDAAWHAALGRLTGGLSPAALATAYMDWALHMIGSPQRQAALLAALRPDAEARQDPATDPRFAHPAWSAYPFKAIASNFLAAQAWWDMATREMPGVDPKHSQIVNFSARQWLDMLSPSNFALTNPQVMSRTVEEKGANLLRGAQYWMDDFNRLLSGHPRRESAHEVGRELALTPGDVVLRNRLMELIRYAPTTPKLHPEPVLIVPAWIMKYYILDLTEQRSLVAFLRDQGFEVYILSWKNPGAPDADLSMQDYIDLGVRAAVTFLRDHGVQGIHAAGYCLGGTLLAISAAAMARDGDDTFRTVSLLAAQVDFSEPGELGLFINESQVAFLEDIMAARGYLRADEMAGAFQLMRSNDLIWSRVVRHYLLGERTPDNPLLAWNADATRMPARMHSEYLRRLFLRNEFAKGRFTVDDAPVAFTDIRCPLYTVATETDHVSPWESVFKVLLLSDTDVTFVLTNGGHNGGILSEPGHAGRHFRSSWKSETDTHIGPAAWRSRHVPQEGSWWTHWSGWLKKHSGDPSDRRPFAVKSLGKAPGKYVFG